MTNFPKGDITEANTIQQRVNDLAAIVCGELWNIIKTNFQTDPTMTLRDLITLFSGINDDFITALMATKTRTYNVLGQWAENLEKQKYIPKNELNRSPRETFGDHDYPAN